mmetsp:Transcript_11707/g.17040  ORF Transcript_11707/g.17040 Transcript_11707/m.17040 type:complete len:399 (-) Transcript_11707:57-1253(-)
MTISKKGKGKKIKGTSIAQGEKKLTLADLDAISDEESHEEGHSDIDEEVLLSEGKEDNEWSAEARALRQAIADGAFDSLAHLDKSGNKREKNDKGGQQEEAQEVELGDDSDDDNDSEPRSKAQEEKTTSSNAISNSKAIHAVTDEICSSRAGMPWPESFDVVPSTILPFGDDNSEGSPLDVHDDLKREVAFYNVALQAVHEARLLCKKNSVPFARPDDFFAEMVKTDDHMAKVKDRLIFETKKMEAFEQRKANKEHKLRAREAHAHRIAEKSKAKKDNLKAVNEWAKNAAASRPSGGMVRDDDDFYLDKLNDGNRKRKGWQDKDGSLQFGPNRKRIAADKKYGFGGKKGRFKQTDRKSLDDMSGYNARMGGTGGQKMRPGAGNNRKGKRARDAQRSRS